MLIANKMESNGSIGHVTVSESTKNILEKEGSKLFHFLKHKDVELKMDEKMIPSYLVVPFE